MLTVLSIAMQSCLAPNGNSNASQTRPKVGEIVCHIQTCVAASVLSGHVQWISKQACI